MKEVSKKSNIDRKKVIAKKKRRNVKRFRLSIALVVMAITGIYMFKGANESALGDIDIDTRVLEETKNIVEEGKNILLVNKTYRLDENYVPKNLVKVDVDFSPESTEEEKYMTEESANALENMFQGALSDNIILKGLSGYRSYETQKGLYNYNIEINGQSYTDNFVAPPGGSEHQLGEAMDVATSYGWIYEGCDEALWLAQNAHKYGFIIRYEKGKENLTGYNYEPWHIRYVGKDVAKEIYKEKLTLEEYIDKEM